MLELLKRFSQPSALPDPHHPGEAESQRLAGHRLVKWRAAIQKRVTELGDLDAVVNKAGLKERARKTPNVDPVPEDVRVRLASALAQPDAEAKLADLPIDRAAGGLDGFTLVAGENLEDGQIVLCGRGRPKVVPGPLK
ncbi:MAG: hypothetical protein ACRDLL_06200 [Solirubrobacterales bacterium]